MMEDSTHYLEKFYNKLFNNLLLGKKLRNKSIIISFLKIKSNTRYRLLDNSSISSLRIPEKVLVDLQKNNLIRSTDNRYQCVITAFGIWKIEMQKGVMNEQKMLEFLDGKFFNLFEGDKPLSDKEKVIITSMIAVRAFSDKSVVDLKKTEISMNALKEIIDSTHEKLVQLGVISLKSAELYGKRGNEHPVSHLIRHTDALPKKTKALFKAAGNQKYYLDLYGADELSQKDLGYLFWLVFEGKMSPDAVDDIIQFCNNVAYTKNIFVFNLKEHIFSNPMFDDIIHDALIDSILSKHKFGIT